MGSDDVERALGAPERLAALSAVGLPAGADPTLDRFAAMVRKILDVPVALVSLVEPGRQVFPGAAGLAEPWAGRRETPLSHSFCRHVVIHAEPFVVRDARTDPRVAGNLAIDDLGVVAYLDAPLMDADGVVLGALCAIDHQPRDWTAGDLDLIADLAAACSDNLRLRSAERRGAEARADARELGAQVRAALDRSQLLLEASVDLTGTATVEEVVESVGHLVRSGLAPELAAVVLHDPERDRLRLAGGTLPDELSQRWRSYPVTADLPAAVAFRTGRTVVLAGAAEVRDAYPRLTDDLAELGWNAMACVPVPGRSGPVGVLVLAWKESRRPDQGEQVMLSTLATYVGGALQRADRLSGRVTAAATLQKALLSRLPRVDNLDIAARYRPAGHDEHVGGDWYDVVALGDHRLAVVIGDVTGHDLHAAAEMSELRSMLRAFLVDRIEPPSALVRRLDTANVVLGARTVASLVVGHLDPAPDGGHRWQWANAGHPPPIVVYPDGRVVTLAGREPLIGVTRRVSRRTHEHHLPPDSTLVLYTDGLVESRAEPMDDVVERLHAVLSAHATVPAEHLADVLLRYADDTGAEDDVAVLVVRITAAG